MSFLVAAVVVGAVTAGVGVAKAISGKKAKKEVDKKAEEAKAEMDARKAEYAQLDTSNPYADYQNQMAENVYEDLTVNQQQAEFEREQQEQQRANIMQGLQGAAGGSGIAALAQQMANQGSLQARQSAASIGQQEVANQKLQAQGELIVQQGEQAAMGKRTEGEIMSRDMERNKVMTLMGMSQSEMAAHNQKAAQAEAMMWGGAGDVGGAVTGLSEQLTSQATAAAGVSDRELKYDINFNGQSPSGLNIYTFKYKDSSFGEGTYQGVMSDEIPSYAVIHHPDGYDMVDYSKIDVNFRKI